MLAISARDDGHASFIIPPWVQPIKRSVAPKSAASRHGWSCAASL